MTVFNDFSENGELLQIREEPLDAANLERYIKVHGIAKAQGYLDALDDMTKLLQGCVEKQRFPIKDGGETIMYNSETVMRRKTESLYDEKIEFLMYAKKIIETIAQGTSADNKTEPT